MQIATIRRHVNESLSDDPRLALIAVRLLLEEDLPWLEQRAVRQARWHGYSWARIGRLLMRSRQAVRARHLELDARPLIFPRDEPQGWAAADLLGRRARADRRRDAEVDAWAADGSVVPW